MCCSNPRSLPVPMICLCVFNLWYEQLGHIKGNIPLVLMHGGIVNGYQLSCDSHTVLEPHRGTAAFFFYFTHYYNFLPFLVVCLSL